MNSVNRVMCKGWVVLLAACVITACNLNVSPTAKLPETAANQPTESPGEIPEATVEPPSITPTTPERLVIDPNNVNNLKPADQVRQSGANEFSWATGGQSIILTTNDGISLYNTYPVNALKQVETISPTLLTVAPDQDTIAWASADNTIHVWSVVDGQELQTLFAGDATVTSLTFTPGGQSLAAATFDNDLKVWDTENGQLVQAWELPVWLSNLSYSPDGKKLAGADLPNFTVYIFDLATGDIQKTLQWTDSASPALYAVYFSPDWTWLAWVARGTVNVMDSKSGETEVVLSHEDFVTATAWAPDGRLLATASAASVDNQFEPVVQLWDIPSGGLINTLVQSSPVVSLSFSPDGKELAVLHTNGTLQTWVVGQ